MSVSDSGEFEAKAAELEAMPETKTAAERLVVIDDEEEEEEEGQEDDEMVEIKPQALEISADGALEEHLLVRREDGCTRRVVR